MKPAFNRGPAFNRENTVLSHILKRPDAPICIFDMFPNHVTPSYTERSKFSTTSKAWTVKMGPSSAAHTHIPYIGNTPLGEGVIIGILC